MTFKQETQEFSKDVELVLQQMSTNKVNSTNLRRKVVSGSLGTSICEIRAKLQIIKL